MLLTECELGDGIVLKRPKHDVTAYFYYFFKSIAFTAVNKNRDVEGAWLVVSVVR